jgi:hypothetical protein
MNQYVAKYLAIGLTLIGMLVGATWLISNAHAEIKNWTLDQDSVRTEQVLRDTERHYVPKEDFVRIETDIKYIKESLKKIEQKLDRQ